MNDVHEEKWVKYNREVLSIFEVKRECHDEHASLPATARLHSKKKGQIFLSTVNLKSVHTKKNITYIIGSKIYLF